MTSSAEASDHSSTSLGGLTCDGLCGWQVARLIININALSVSSTHGRETPADNKTKRGRERGSVKALLMGLAQTAELQKTTELRVQSTVRARVC